MQSESSGREQRMRQGIRSENPEQKSTLKDPLRGAEFDH